MAIEIREIEKLAGLARIAVSDEEKNILQHDLEEILAYVSQITNAEEQGVGTEEREVGVLYNVMREDGVPHEAGIFTEDILKQAPTRDGNRVSVKKIL